MSRLGLERLNLGNLIKTRADEHADRAFLRSNDSTWTYQQAAEQSARLAAGLVGLGLAAGDRLGLILPNIPEFVLSLFAGAQLGAILLPINVRRSRNEIRARFARTRPKVVISFSSPEESSGRDHVREALELCQEVPECVHVVAVGPAPEDGLRLSDLMEGARLPALPELRPEDPAALIHTLGSSGQPRGALLSHRGLLQNAASMVEVMDAGPDDIFLGSVPFSNTFGLTATILACAIAAGELVCLPVYDPGEALSQIQAHRVTIHHGLPTMFAMELNHPDFRPAMCVTLRSGIMAGAHCPPQLVRRVRDEMGYEVLLAYGLTEASPGVTMTRPGDGPVTSTETVGKPLEGVGVRVTDPEGQALPSGREGELQVRGYNVMLGYWDDPQGTARVLDADGWLRTGDLGQVDADGVVRVTGRADDMLRRAGFTIHPGTVEMAFRTHTAVKEVAVVGVPDLILGEMSCACVVPRAGVDIDVSILREHIAGSLPEYAIPDRILLFDHLPRRGAGPVDKAYLRARVRIRGRAWKFGKNIDTDAIIPARRCNTSDPSELAMYCMEDADPDFADRMQRGDLIVAGSNFGCGSSREVAPLAIKAAGVSAVVAHSFARIFFRNAINIGLPILESPEAVDGIREQDEVEIEPATGTIRNLTTGQAFRAQPFPDFLQAIIDRGGLIPYVEERLRLESLDGSSTSAPS